MLGALGRLSSLEVVGVDADDARLGRSAEGEGAQEAGVVLWAVYVEPRLRCARRPALKMHPSFSKHPRRAA